MIDMRPLTEVDPRTAGLIRRDVERQNSNIHLIASENFASPAVMAASGSIFTNKYAEATRGVATTRGAGWWMRSRTWP